MYGYSFSRVKFVEKREIRGTDYAQGHTYDDILVQNGGYLLSILQTFCNAREKMFANSLPFVTWEVYFSVFSSRIL